MFMLRSPETPPAPAITTVLGHGRRRKLNRCSLKDLDGAYRAEVNGWVNLFAVPVAERLLGRVQANGTGGLSASFIKSVGGAISEENTTGSYTVASDCTFAMSFV